MPQKMLFGLCRAKKLQQEENAESEMGAFWMNNVALNETAALYHQILFTNYILSDICFTYEFNPLYFVPLSIFKFLWFANLINNLWVID